MTRTKKFNSRAIVESMSAGDLDQFRLKESSYTNSGNLTYKPVYALSSPQVDVEDNVAMINFDRNEMDAIQLTIGEDDTVSVSPVKNVSSKGWNRNQYDGLAEFAEETFLVPITSGGRRKKQKKTRRKHKKGKKTRKH